MHWTHESFGCRRKIYKKKIMFERNENKWNHYFIFMARKVIWDKLHRELFWLVTRQIPLPLSPMMHRAFIPRNAAVTACVPTTEPGFWSSWGCGSPYPCTVSSFPCTVSTVQGEPTLSQFQHSPGPRRQDSHILKGRTFKRVNTSTALENTALGSTNSLQNKQGPIVFSLLYFLLFIYLFRRLDPAIKVHKLIHTVSL